MSEKVLFVLEGKVKEPDVLDAIWEFVFAHNRDHKPPKVVYTYCTHIYTLFKELSADPDLDLLGLLKEDDHDGILADTDGDTFSSVYLFFDYDGHVNMPQKDSGGHWDGDDILAEMLARIGGIARTTWAEIIGYHLAAAAFLHHGTSVIDSTVSQKDIFNRQKYYIAQSCPQVVVLSGFPLFILDYFGAAKTLELLS